MRRRSRSGASGLTGRPRAAPTVSGAQGRAWEGYRRGQGRHLSLEGSAQHCDLPQQLRGSAWTRPCWPAAHLQATTARCGAAAATALGACVATKSTSSPGPFCPSGEGHMCGWDGLCYVALAMQAVRWGACR